jgi:MYXO-CTERM domain-containing protein
MFTGSESWVDLNAFLPPQFTRAQAKGIWSDENFTYVVGQGYASAADRWEAVMWVGPAPEPASGLLGVTGMAIFTLLRRRRK